MPIGYGYKATDDLGIVDWAEVTKGFVGMLDEEKKRREDLKAYYDEQDRNLTKDLMKSPMGQFTDATKFTSNYVDAMTKQRLIDNRLFKQGLLSERDYILKTNNAVDGTKGLFDLAQVYQDKFGQYMKGVQDGTLTQQQVFNMMQVEGFKDFSNSKAVLDPKTGAVTLMKLKKNEKTGVMETTGENMPIGTAMRLLGTELKTYDIEGAMKSKVASFGKLADAIYDAPSIREAGTITLTEGPEAFSEYPEAKSIVDNFYKAVDTTIAGWIDNKYNLSSVLTQNTGLGYSAESMTMSREEADKDDTKILMKIDPATGITIMDDTGKNFKKQQDEAAKWIRTNMLSQIDRERKIQQVGQLSDPNAAYKLWKAQYDAAKKEGDDNALNFAYQLANYVTGDPQQVALAQAYLGQHNINIDKDDNYIYVDGQQFPLNATAEDITKSLLSSGKEALSVLGTNERSVLKYLGGFVKGKPISKGTVNTDYFNTEEKYNETINQLNPMFRSLYPSWPKAKSIFQQRAGAPTPPAGTPAAAGAGAPSLNATKRKGG